MWMFVWRKAVSLITKLLFVINRQLPSLTQLHTLHLRNTQVNILIYYSLRQFLCVLCFMCGPFNNWCFYGNGKLYVSGVNLRPGLTGLIIDLANWHSYFVLRVFWFTTLNIKTIKCQLLWINSKFRFILDSRDFIYYSMLLTLLSFR